MRRLPDQWFKSFSRVAPAAAIAKIAVLSFLLMCTGITAAIASPLPFFDKEVTGHILTSDGSPLMGVTVSLKGSTTAVVTDIAGAYTNEQRSR